MGVVIRCESATAIACPVERVWRFVVTDFFDNYPRWSPQVEALRKLSDGPIDVGTRGFQVRVDHGRRTQSHFVVKDLQPLRTVCFEGEDYPYRIHYSVTPATAGTQLYFAFELTALPAPLRPVRGLFRRVVEHTTAPVADDIRALIEAEARE